MTKKAPIVSFLFFLISAPFAPEAIAESLDDFIPGTRKFEALKEFVVEHVDTGKDRVAVQGNIRGKQMQVVQTAGKKGMRFAVEALGSPLAMSDIIPEMKGLPGDGAIRIEGLIFDEKALTIRTDIRISTAELALEIDPKNLIARLKARASSVTVGSLFPDLKDTPVVNALLMEELTFKPGQKSVSGTGKIRATEATLSVDLEKGVENPVFDLKFLAGAAFPDVLPEIKPIPVVSDFTLEDLRYDRRAKAISGTGHIRKTEASLTLDTSKGMAHPVFDLKFLAGSALPDFLPDLKDVPMVGDFVLEDLRCDPRAHAVSGTGKVRKTEATLTLDTSKSVADPVFDLKFVTGSALPDVLPEIEDVPLVGDFVLEDLRYIPRAHALSGTGKVRKTEATLTLDTSKGGARPVFDLKFLAGSALPDVIPELEDAPVLGNFVLEDLHYDPRAKSISGTGKVRKTEAVLTLDTSNGLKKPVFGLKIASGITLPDVLPQLSGVPVVGDVSFDAARYDRGQKSLLITGVIHGKTVKLEIAKTPDLLVDLSADKQIGLADAITELKDLPGIDAFGIKELALKGRTISADMVFVKETAKLSITLPQTGGTGRFSAFKITPDTSNISVGKLFPDLSGMPGLKDFSLSELDFAEKTKSLISSIKLGSGSSAKTARISTTPAASKGHGPLFKLSSPHLTIADMIPSLGHIPLFGALKFDELDITGLSMETTVEIGGETVKLFASLKNGFAALDFGSLDAASFIPAAKDTVLKDVKLASSVFVVAKSANLLPSDLPADMLKDMGGVDVKKPFKQGINLLANLRKEDLGPQLSGLFDKLSIKAPSFPVDGVFPSEVFDFVKQAKQTGKDAKKAAGDAKDEIVTAVLDAIDLNIDIPVPQIAPLKKFASFDTAQISITGNSGDDPFWKSLPADMQKKKPTGRLDVSMRGGVTLNLASFDSSAKTPVKLQSLIDLNAGGDAKSISLLGRVDGSWDKPFGIKGLTLEKSGFDISLSTGGKGAKAALDFFSAATLHGKTDLEVDAAFSENGGLPKLDYFVLDGPLALSDIAGELPNAGNFIIHEVKLYPDGLEAQVEAKNKLLDERTNLYLFELDTTGGKTLVAAIDLAFNAKTQSKQHFSLGKLASIAGLKGGKSDTIQSHLNAMAVANAALILSSKKIYPVEPDHLQNGIAKDLFTSIFGESKVPVKLDNVTFLSDFQADLMGDIGDKLVHGVKGVKIGLTEDAVINGAIGGLFDSDPLSLDLEFLMAQSLSLDQLQKNGLKLPSFLKAKPAKMGQAEKIGIFLKVVDVTFEAGLLAGFDVEYNDTTFDFTGTLGVQLAEEEVGLSLSGSMSDTWKNALGIKGFELENVAVSGEVQPDPPSIKVGLGGDANLWGHDMSTYGDLSVGLVGEVPIPEGLGVKTTVSDLDVTMYEILNTVTLAAYADVVIDPPLWPIILVGVVGEVGLSEGYTVIYDKVKGKKVTAKDLAEAPFKDFAQLVKDYSKLEAWIFGGKDIYMSFATPGMSDANLGIPDGIHFSGRVELFGGALKSPAIQPNIAWIYKTAQGIYGAGQKVKHAASDAGHDAEHGASHAKGKATAMTKEEFKRFKHQVTLLRDIIAKEAGLTKKKIEVDYVKPSEKEMQEFLDSLSFTQKEAFKLGGLEFYDNQVSLLPFKVQSKTKLFGNEEDVALSLKGGKLVLETQTKIEMLGQTDLVLEFDMEKQDFMVVGEYSNDPALQDWLAKEIRSGIQQIASTADGKLKALDADLKKAQKLSDDAQHDLELAQKAADAVTQAAVDRLQDTTNGYKNTYEHANHEYHHCHGWKKYYCKAKWWPRKSLAWDTWKASEQLLADAKKALSEAKSLAVAVHNAEIKVNNAATQVALAAKDVAAATEIEDIVNQGLKTLTDNAGKMAKLFSLDKAFIAGSVKDVLGGKPLVIEVFFEIDGKKYREFFALSPTDPEFNALAFGLLPIIAAEHAVEDLEKTLERELSPALGSVGNLSAKLTTWIKAHIYELTGGMRDDLEKKIANIQYELSQEESKYKKVFESIDKHADEFLDGYKDLTDQSNQILSTYKMTDFMPKSAAFQNEYLAVGHSALCLGVADNGIDVYQQNCKDTDAERWTAVPDKTQEGYIQLSSKGLCLQARNVDAQSGQPLILAQCSGKDDHEKWKFLSQDGEFSKFVNRYSQKCLHFDTENANEKTGYAVWTSCFGADSEGFRVIGDAEKPTFHKVEQRVGARNGSCLTVDKDFEKYFFKTEKGYSTSSRDHLLGMQRVKDNTLHAGSCGASGNSLFNYVEAVNGDLKLVHAQSGWCIVPAGQQMRNEVVLMPCDNDKDMYWRAQESGESAFVLRNDQTGKCLDLGSPRRSGPNTRFAVTVDCQASPGQILEFVEK